MAFETYGRVGFIVRKHHDSRHMPLDNAAKEPPHLGRGQNDRVLSGNHERLYSFHGRLCDRIGTAGIDGQIFTLGLTNGAQNLLFQVGSSAGVSSSSGGGLCL